jgi:hypothetical protein
VKAAFFSKGVADEAVLADVLQSAPTPQVRFDANNQEILRYVEDVGQNLVLEYTDVFRGPKSKAPAHMAIDVAQGTREASLAGEDKLRLIYDYTPATSLLFTERLLDKYHMERNVDLILLNDPAAAALTSLFITSRAYEYAQAAARIVYVDLEPAVALTFHGWGWRQWWYINGVGGGVGQVCFCRPMRATIDGLVTSTHKTYVEIAANGKTHTSASWCVNAEVTLDDWLADKFNYTLVCCGRRKLGGNAKKPTWHHLPHDLVKPQRVFLNRRQFFCPTDGVRNAINPDLWANDRAKMISESTRVYEDIMRAASEDVAGGGGGGGGSGGGGGGGGGVSAAAVAGTDAAAAEDEEDGFDGWERETFGGDKAWDDESEAESEEE